MVSNSPVNGWPIYDSDDELSIDAAVGELAEAVDDVLIPANTTIFRAGAVPLNAGRVYYATDRKILEVYDGAIWRDAERTTVRQLSDVFTSNTTVRDVPGVAYQVFAGGTYFFDAQVNFLTPNGAIFSWSLPSGTTGRWVCPHETNITVNLTSDLTIDESSRTLARIIGFMRVTNTGIAQFRVRKGSGSGSLTLYAFGTSVQFFRID